MHIHSFHSFSHISPNQSHAHTHTHETHKFTMDQAQACDLHVRNEKQNFTIAIDNRARVVFIALLIITINLVCFFFSLFVHHFTPGNAIAIFTGNTKAGTDVGHEWTEIAAGRFGTWKFGIASYPFEQQHITGRPSTDHSGRSYSHKFNIGATQ